MARKGAAGWRLGLSGLLLFLEVLGAIPSARTQTNQTQSLCYAFLKGDASIGHDLHINCGAGEERITTGKDVWDFAVAMDASALALLRQKGTEKGFRLTEKGLRPSSVGPRQEVEVVSLSRPFRRRWTGRGDLPAGLHASCGTILVTEDTARLLPSGEEQAIHTTYDILAGKMLRYEPYISFRCSSDRTALVGRLNTDRWPLMAGWPPNRKVVEVPASGYVATYAISPNGQYVAYVTNLGLCAEDHGRTLGCVGVGTTPRRVSVSDSMGVLFDTGTGQTWYCNDTGNCSLENLPGYKPADESIGVAYWRPGDKAAQVLEIFGSRPQWITPEAAAALRAWRSHEGTADHSK